MSATDRNCHHYSTRVVCVGNENGSVELEICANKTCARIVQTICEHRQNVWHDQDGEPVNDPVNDEGVTLLCALCGADGT